MTRSSTPAIRAYLGGSFNPVHNAHIQMAMLVYDALAPIAAEQNRELQVCLLPNARSPFKQQVMAPKHRLAMLKLAIAGTPLQIEELELWQTPPVYTIDSVRALRQRYPNDSLIFIMGMDSARSLDKWHQGLELTDYVHLWIFDRDNGNGEKLKNITDLVSELPIELQSQVTESYAELLTAIASTIEVATTTTAKDLPLKTGAKGRIYIHSQTLTPILGISSTEIRQQLLELSTSLASDATLETKPTDWLKHLNLAVYHYIIAHRLYSAA